MDYCQIQYNLGKFRLIDGKKVYYILFKFIPIYITTITNKTFYDNKNTNESGRLSIFHKIVDEKLN